MILHSDDKDNGSHMSGPNTQRCCHRYWRIYAYKETKDIT